MISYAQNQEDVVLARAFGDQVRGLYIDVGAEHPVVNSVTKHFYDQGWRGINVEPTPSALAMLEVERVEDINLGVGLADGEGKATLFEGPSDNHGASTFSPDLAARYRRLGQVFTELPDVPLTTLALVCEEYVGDRTVDFLKIDVEGFEAAVIEGADWERWRPRVVVVEATEPNGRQSTHEAWEARLLAAGYRFALFDGLNRFYGREDEPALLTALSSPACVFDDFVVADRQREREETAARLADSAAEVETLGAELASTARDLVERDLALAERDRALAERDGALAAAHAAQVDAERRATESEATAHQWEVRARHSERMARLQQDRSRHAEDELLRAELAAAALRDRVADEITARVAAEQVVAAERTARQATDHELEALRATKTFRWVAPLRQLYALMRRVSR